MNALQCPDCWQEFFSLDSFDAHRGKGRRCLSVPEMEIHGLREDDMGLWHTPITLKVRSDGQ